jgi:hypothetical protein
MMPWPVLIDSPSQCERHAGRSSTPRAVNLGGRVLLLFQEKKFLMILFKFTALRVKNAFYSCRGMKNAAITAAARNARP